MAAVQQATEFLNVDLELLARVDVSLLMTHLAPATVTLRDSEDEGLRTIWLELAAGNPVSPADAILQYVRLVQNLPGDARRLWDLCEDRCFNVGIQSGLTPHAQAFPISVEAIAGMAAIYARLEITVYRSEATGAP